jgi:hypothetical protein
MAFSRILRGVSVLALFAGAAWAAGVTGKWTAQRGGPDGDGPTVTFSFKQDGGTLTGSIDGPGGPDGGPRPMTLKRAK